VANEGEEKERESEEEKRFHEQRTQKNTKIFEDNIQYQGQCGIY